VFHGLMGPFFDRMDLAMVSNDIIPVQYCWAWVCWEMSRFRMHIRSGKSRKDFPRPRAVSRWLLLVLGVVAIGVQSFIVKPHFHLQETLPLAGFAEMLVGANAGDVRLTSTDVEDEAPTGIEFSDCLMCQSAHQNGHFLRPAAQTWSSPPVSEFRAAEFDRFATVGTVVSFHWQTRAPPQS